MSLRTIFCSLFVLACCASAPAQIVITSTDFTNFEKWGEVFLIDTTAPASVTVGAASKASAQTFDFSSFSFSNKSNRTLVDPSTTPGASKFVGPPLNQPTYAYADTMSLIGQSTPGYSYYQIQQVGKNNMGFVNSSVAIILQPPIISCRLPMDTMTFAWQSNSISRDTINSVITVTGTISQSLKGNVDAFGILKTKDRGSFACMRVHQMTSTVTKTTPSTFDDSVADIKYIYFTRQGETIEVTLKDSTDDGKATITPQSITYTHPQGPPAAVNENNLSPENASLLNAYPNPSHGVTTISFTLLDRSAVTAELVNMLGERVATPVTGTQEAGFHNVQVNTADVIPGSYFLRLIVNGKTEVHPIVVMK